MRMWKCSKSWKTRSWWGKALSSIHKSLMSDSSWTSHHPGDFQYKCPVTKWLRTVNIVTLASHHRRRVHHHPGDFQYKSRAPKSDFKLWAMFLSPAATSPAWLLCIFIILSIEDDRLCSYIMSGGNVLFSVAARTGQCTFKCQSKAFVLKLIHI